METIELNGKKYVDIEEYNNLKYDYDEFQKRPREAPRFNLIQKQLPIDPCNIIAISTVELGGDWFYSRYTLSYIKKAIRALDAFDVENVDIVCSKDYPICFGRIEKDGNKVTGIIIAPRVETE